MAEYLPVYSAQWLLPLLALVLALSVWLVYRHRTRGARHLKKVFAEIGYDRIDKLIIPNGDDGEIQIDHLFLKLQMTHSPHQVAQFGKTTLKPRLRYAAPP